MVFCSENTKKKCAKSRNWLAAIFTKSDKSQLFGEA
jgi:hypothetical protein